MSAVRETLRNLLSNEQGATAIEYGLIVALIAIAAMGALSGLGGGVGGMWTNLSTTASTYL